MSVKQDEVENTDLEPEPIIDKKTVIIFILIGFIGGILMQISS